MSRLSDPEAIYEVEPSFRLTPPKPKEKKKARSVPTGTRAWKLILYLHNDEKDFRSFVATYPEALERRRGMMETGRYWKSWLIME